MVGFVVLAGVCVVIVGMATLSFGFVALASIVGGASLAYGFSALTSIGVAIVGGAVLTLLLVVPMLEVIGPSVVGLVAGDSDPFHNGGLSSRTHARSRHTFCVIGC